jgi:hypothetical protein
MSTIFKLITSIGALEIILLADAFLFQVIHAIIISSVSKKLTDQVNILLILILTAGVIISVVAFVFIVKNIILL